MAQTPCLVLKGGSVVEHTAAADIIAGEVIVNGSIPMIATEAADSGDKCSLETSNQWKVPQNAEIITKGDAVHWDEDGSPYGGTASSGCATATASNNTLMGECLETTTATTTYVKILLTAAKRTATIAGAVTATSITGSDATLDVAGIAGSTGAGGSIPIVGGAGDGNAAGGLVSVTGGAGAGTADGGAASVVAGAAGATGNGGAVAVTGGAGTAGIGGLIAITAGAGGGNGAGGAVGMTAGLGTGTEDGGAASLIAGAGGATGDGGAVAITGGAGPAAGNVGGAVTILSGAGGNNGVAGAVILDSSGTGGTKGAVTIATNAATLTLGKMPRIPVAAVTSAGANLATAGALSEGFNLLSASDNAKGVRLPSCVDGAQCIVVNMVTDKSVLIYPPVGKQVNNAGANNAINVALNTVGIFVSEGANAWYGLHASTDTA